MCYCTILFMHPQFLTKNNKSWSLKGLKIKNKYHKLSNTIKHKYLVKLDQMLNFSKNQICILKIWLSSHFECIEYFLWPPDIILWTTFKYGARKNTSNCLFVFLIEKKSHERHPQNETLNIKEPVTYNNTVQSNIYTFIISTN